MNPGRSSSNDKLLVLFLKPDVAPALCELRVFMGTLFIRVKDLQIAQILMHNKTVFSPATILIVNDCRENAGHNTTAKCSYSYTLESILFCSIHTPFHCPLRSWDQQQKWSHIVRHKQQDASGGDCSFFSPQSTWEITHFQKHSTPCSFFTGLAVPRYSQIVRFTHVPDILRPST